MYFLCNSIVKIVLTSTVFVTSIYLHVKLSFHYKCSIILCSCCCQQVLAAASAPSISLLCNRFKMKIFYFLIQFSFLASTTYFSVSAMIPLSTSLHFINVHKRPVLLIHLSPIFHLYHNSNKNINQKRYQRPKGVETDASTRPPNLLASCDLDL